MQYFVLPTLVTATSLLAAAAPVNKNETGVQPLAPPATRPGAPLVLQWNPDVSGSKKWKHMSISLVSVDKNGHKNSTKLVSDIDGTNPNKATFTTEAPKHPKDSTVYFVQFSDGKSTKNSPKFTIEDGDGKYQTLSRRHGDSESPEAMLNSDLFSTGMTRQASDMEDSVHSGSSNVLNAQVQNDGSGSAGQDSANDGNAPNKILQGPLGAPVNIGGLMYVPVLPKGLLDSMMDSNGEHSSESSQSSQTPGSSSTATSSASGKQHHTTSGVNRHILANSVSMDTHAATEGIPTATTTPSAQATQTVTSSPQKSANRKHASNSAHTAPSESASKSSHHRSSQHSTGNSTASTTGSQAPMSSLASALSKAQTGSESKVSSLASGLPTMSAMDKRSDENTKPIISRIATANSKVSSAFAADTSGAGNGNLTNTATSSGNPSSTSSQTKSKSHASATSHDHGNSTSSASPTSSSSGSSSQPSSASMSATGSSTTGIDSSMLSSLATMSESQIPEALSSLGMTDSVSMFAGMDPMDGFRTSSHSKSASPTSSSSSSEPSSSKSSSQHRSGPATQSQNSASSGRPTSTSSGRMTRSRGSGTRSSGSQRQTTDAMEVLAQGILGDTGLSPAQVSRYYAQYENRHSTHGGSQSATRSASSSAPSSGGGSSSASSSGGGSSSASSNGGGSSSASSSGGGSSSASSSASQSGAGRHASPTAPSSQGILSHGQGEMSASLNYKHGYESVSQSF